MKMFKPIFNSLTLRYQMTAQTECWIINHHSGTWGIQEAPLPLCQNLWLPSTREWLFSGQQGRYDLESCCRLYHQDSLLQVHYKNEKWFCSVMVLFGFIIETDTSKIYFDDYKIENILKRWICENVKRCMRKRASSISQNKRK
jgi:hypothetical protein